MRQQGRHEPFADRRIGAHLLPSCGSINFVATTQMTGWKQWGYARSSRELKLEDLFINGISISEAKKSAAVNC